jgi:hypothetical protein
VDENGEPLVVWHYSPNKFKVFKEQVHGIFFTNNREHANVFGDVQYPVYISIKNPYIMDENELGASAAEYKYKDLDEENTNADGIIGYSIINYRTKDAVNEYNVRKSNQIKHVDNLGTFNPDDANMYHIQITRTVQNGQ